MDQPTDDRFLVDGFVVLPGVGRSLVRPLRRLHRELIGRAPFSFDSTLYSPDIELKTTVNRRLMDHLLPLLDDVLADHRPLLANYVTKGRDPRAAMPPHQDWSFVDERSGCSLNAWMPLINVTPRNGAISLLPGGHLVPYTIRGTATENPFDSIEADAARAMVPVPMRAGDLLIHDHRVLHGSPPNRGRRARLAVACALIGQDAVPLHYRRRPDGILETYEIEESFFTEHTFGLTDLPPAVRHIGDTDFEQPALTTSDLPARSAS